MTLEQLKMCQKDNQIDWKKNICKHPEHNPPTHICIPTGETHTHICPHCKRETILRSSEYWL